MYNITELIDALKEFQNQSPLNDFYISAEEMTDILESVPQLTDKELEEYVKAKTT